MTYTYPKFLRCIIGYPTQHYLEFHTKIKIISNKINKKFSLNY
jgi:hypothetical protein